MLRVPIELPGAMIPLLNTLPKIVPLPLRVPAAPTATLPATLPLTDKVPASTAVPPV